ncbi:leucine-rich repeat domain-containing protein [Paramagnetospirillum caucaseum]|uniref:leucine-rich repeat domain-containing protein n=1 Tax=Paramagnetospirillum caucaseum TaxID=1244869 RepID=UPI000349FA24|nr:hypothetical protein [Paramagnetospirillum caucaseum]
MTSDQENFQVKVEILFKAEACDEAEARAIANIIMPMSNCGEVKIIRKITHSNGIMEDNEIFLYVYSHDDPQQEPTDRADSVTTAALIQDELVEEPHNKQEKFEIQIISQFKAEVPTEADARELAKNLLAHKHLPTLEAAPLAKAKCEAVKILRIYTHSDGTLEENEIFFQTAAHEDLQQELQDGNESTVDAWEEMLKAHDEMLSHKQWPYILQELEEDKAYDGSIDIGNEVIEYIPEGVQFTGSVNFNHCDILMLPSGMSVGGCLEIVGTGIKEIPEDLLIGGNLVIDPSVTRIPESYSLRGSLYLHRLDDSKPCIPIPKNVKIGGDIVLSIENLSLCDLFADLCFRNNVEIRRKSDIIFPNDVRFSGNLNISETGITKLPDNLNVGGSLDLSKTKITSLPDGLKVGGDLKLCGSGITSLPDNLSIGGSLDLSNTKVTSLPDRLKVGGYLDLCGTGITKLPDGLKISGYLDLSDTQITSLPENICVVGSLLLGGSMIEFLPSNIAIGGNLDLRGTPIPTLPENLIVQGDLLLRCTKISKLPENLRVDGDLDLCASSICDLPENLIVGGDLIISNTEITSIPSGAKISGIVRLDGQLLSRRVYVMARAERFPAAHYYDIPQGCVDYLHGWAYDYYMRIGCHVGYEHVLYCVDRRTARDFERLWRSAI